MSSCRKHWHLSLLHVSCGIHTAALIMYFWFQIPIEKKMDFTLFDLNTLQRAFNWSWNSIYFTCFFLPIKAKKTCSQRSGYWIIVIISACPRSDITHKDLDHTDKKTLYVSPQARVSQWSDTQWEDIFFIYFVLMDDETWRRLKFLMKKLKT